MRPDPDSALPPPAEVLLQHVDWIRRLARQMVADADVADDLAQETCVAALEHDPRDRSRLRPWLASIMRNALRERRRGESRRSVREERTARAEASESTARLVERVALERELVGAVLELDEPFRTTIMLRFFEDLPPRVIAERLGVGVNTVNSRLTRGLERLRARLDRAHGDRKSWVLALAPLSKVPETGALAVAGGILVNAKLVSMIVVLLAVLAAVATFALRSPNTPSTAAQSGTKTELAHEDGTELASESKAARARSLAGETPELDDSKPASSSTVPVVPPVARTVRGRVLDAEGGPQPGIRLHFDGDSGAIAATSGAGGWFELRTTVATGELRSADDHWLTIRAGAMGRPGGPPPMVIVGPWIELAGHVVDEVHRGVLNAHVTVLLPEGFTARFTDTLEGTHLLGWDARSIADGAFDLGRVPDVAGMRLRVMADGYERSFVDPPRATTHDLLLEVARPKVAPTGALRGRVVDPNGAPVPGARVAAGLASTVSDERGQFAMDLGRAVTAESLTAVKLGFLPATMQRPKDPTPSTSGWPDTVELVLGGPPLSIRGQVVDRVGKPCAGLRVWIDDPTPFGLIGRAAFSQEGLLSGQTVPPQALATEPRPGAVDGDNFFDWRSDEAPATAFWSWVRTDDEGRFEIGGLMDRRYKIAVFDEHTLARHTSDPIRAGDHDAKIELPPPAMWPVVSGIVRSDMGVALRGVDVQLVTEAFGVRSRVFGGRAAFMMMQPRESVTTDEAGRFEFHDVPQSGLRLQLESDRIVPDDFFLQADRPATDLDVRVFARCGVQVELRPPQDRASAIGFEDANGKRLDVLVITAGSVNAYTAADIVEGRSEVVSVSSAARFLLLLRDETTVERVPIQLTPEGVNRLTP